MNESVARGSEVVRRGGKHVRRVMRAYGRRGGKHVGWGMRRK